ncbi:hypothetical protein Fmac_000247 [Flemingia macrophylla]|uniref:Uncharacterized protein n=1 Tax=Flemingia macrophylla TaxID=520843 RepID=A0ABD1NF00_9FABA
MDKIVETTTTTAKRQSASSASKGFNAARQFSEKSKKEKVRSLSAVAKALSMGCRVSQSPKPSNKFKLPRKLPKDCSGVDHASVPRKIRSAVKKRGRESVFGDSEKVNHGMNGMESPQKEGIKKSKKRRSPGWSMPGPITKDEEEVVETLYALAGMFPDNASNAKSELESESLPENSTLLQDQEESLSANATIEASGTTRDAGERSPTGCKINSFSNETIVQERTDFPESAKLLVTAPKINLQPVPTMVRSENVDKVALHDSELSLEMGLNVPVQPLISHIGRKSDVEFQTAGGIDCKQEQHIIKYQKGNEGPTLWSGFSPTAPAGISASYLLSSAGKVPDWLNIAIGAPKQDLMESCFSGGKISEIATQKKSWKTCAAHVHISHLIRGLEVSKGQVGKEHELYECHQMRAHQGTKSRVLMEAQNLNWIRNGNSYATVAVRSATTSDSRETKNDILQHGLYLGVSQSPPTPGVYCPQKHSFNFLSLSTGGSELKVNESFKKGESKLEPLSKSQVPYFHLLRQQHGLVPIQSPYSSSAFLDQFPVAEPQVRLQQQQPPHYYGTPLRGDHFSSYKQQHQSFWAVQLTAQAGSAVNCSIDRTQYPNWQSGRYDSSVASPYALPHSPASFEALECQISEQHLFTLASSRSKPNGHDTHVPSVCEESKGRFLNSSSSRGIPSLQLLCDERI